MTIDARIPLMVNPVKSDLDRQQSLADLAARQQQTDLQRQQWEEKQRSQEVAAKREQVEMTAKLLRGVQDEQTYQQRIAAARAYGIDVSGAPANFDPQWVQTYSTIAETLLQPDGEAKLTTTAQELRDAGYQPGTPVFIAKMRERLALADSKVVTTQAGGMASLLGYGGQTTPLVLPNPGGAQPGSPATGGAVRVQSMDEAKRLPPGTRFIDPKGVERIVPGGAASNGSGGF